MLPWVEIECQILIFWNIFYITQWQQFYLIHWAEENLKEANDDLANHSYEREIVKMKWDFILKSFQCFWCDNSEKSPFASENPI